MKPAYLLAVALLVAAVGLFFATPAPADTRAPGTPGRWQIINPTPDRAMNIMLLDTATGDSWVTCMDENGGHVWCIIDRTSAHSVNKPQGRSSPSTPPLPSRQGALNEVDPP